MNEAQPRGRTLPLERRSGRPIRVLMGVPSQGATRGGLALCVPMLAEDLQQRDDVELVAIPYGRWQENEPLPLKIWHQLVDLIRYPGRVRQANPDVVHLNTSLDRRALVRDTIFALVTQHLGKRAFLTWHGWETPLLHTGAWGWRRLGRILLRHVDAVGTLSASDAEDFRQLPQVPPCFVVKNGIDLPRYQGKVELHARLGLPPGTPLLLFISRLIPGKGLEDVVAAMPAVSQRHPAHLLVDGDGPRRRAAEEMSHALGLQETVHFLGALSEDEARQFYNGAEILIFPSCLREGFPMVLFQGVAAGLGIVTTRLRAAVEHLREPEHCLFVESQAPAAIAAALDRLLSDPDLLARMRANNRVLAGKFERKKVAEEFYRIYRELAEGPRSVLRHAGAAGWEKA